MPLENTNTAGNAGQPPENVSLPEMEAFIFGHDDYKAGIVPRQLDPVEVAKFLLNKVDKKIDAAHFRKVELAANFYDSFEVAEKFKTFLTKDEANTAELKRSIVIARIIGSLGNAESVEFAKQYYNYLVQKVDAFDEFQELIYLHEVLNLGVNSAAIRQKIQTKLAGLEAKKGEGYDSRVAYLDFQEKINTALNRAERVQAIKDKILALDRKQRLEEEIKAYLTHEYGFLEYLQPWATNRVRRETYSAKIADQNTRQDVPALREDVNQSLRAYLEKLSTVPHLSDPAKEGAKLSILRAIKFFGGKVSETEEDFLGLHRTSQSDVLANEGFLLQ